VTISLRPFTLEDQPFVRELFELSLENERQRAPGLALPPDVGERYLLQLIRDAGTKGGAILIAEREGERAGFIAALPQDQPSPWDESSGKSCIVMELHTHPRFQRQGVATALLRSIEQRFAELGFDWITLGVFATNGTARTLYASKEYRDSYVFMGKRLPSDSGGRSPGEAE
jgi:ribosomal protein S18 acetylase RimI-like enzyme